MPTVAEIKDRSRRMLAVSGAPSNAAHLRRLAEKYERSYRRWRASRRPPTREHLCGALQTARAFYSLSREAPNA